MLALRSQHFAVGSFLRGITAYHVSSAALSAGCTWRFQHLALANAIAASPHASRHGAHFSFRMGYMGYRLEQSFAHGSVEMSGASCGLVHHHYNVVLLGSPQLPSSTESQFPMWAVHLILLHPRDLWCSSESRLSPAWLERKASITMPLLRV